MLLICNFYFSGLCAKLADGAKQGDALCLYLFKEAGILMAKTIIALRSKIDPSLYEKDPLKIICVGSVWLSWDFIKPGFLQVLDEQKLPFDIEFVRLTTSTALGTIYLAADFIKFNFAREFEKNYNVFFKYEGRTLFGKAALTNGNSRKKIVTNGVHA